MGNQLEGVYNFTNSEYHAQTWALSSTGARKILKSPALFRYEQLNGSTPTPAMDFGSVAHKLVLKKGDEIAVLDHKDFRTLQAKAERDEARSKGHTPILAADMENATRMAHAVRTHPIAGHIFASGVPEQSLFWKTGGVWRRAMVDWMTEDGLVDYKTTTRLDDHSIERTIHEYGYHQQAAWYLDGAEALGFPCKYFKFVFQMKDAPYLVRVVELDSESVEIGRRLNEDAMRIYRDCDAFDEWPGYDEEVTLGLPGWARG